eukprot:6048650-Ditylum_brightwellii.AAC.1
MVGDYTMTAICAFMIPVLQCMFCIMKWTKGELQKLDIKTRKLSTIKGIHHSKGGRGLIGDEDTHNCECAALLKYVLNSTDPLTQM